MTQSKPHTDLWNSVTLDLICIQVKGRIVFINAAGARMLGAIAPAQLIGKSILDFVHPDYREIAAERDRQMTSKRFMLCPTQEGWIRLDGKVIKVEVAALRVVYEGQPAVQLIACEDKSCKLGQPARNRHPTFMLRRTRR
jgi:PAS domain S-box-containing protein